MAYISIVLIPYDPSEPLEAHNVVWNEKFDVNSGPFWSKVHRRILSLLHRDDDDAHDADGDLSAIDDRVEVPLLRPHGKSHGLYAFSRSGETPETASANIRATRLAMACGLMKMRFFGTVVVARSNNSGRPRWTSITVDDIWQACERSPDLRASIQKELVIDGPTVAAAATAVTPLWIKNAAQQNYHDAAVVARMLKLMKSKGTPNEEKDEEEKTAHSGSNDTPTTFDSATSNQLTAIAKTTLCLQCRIPANILCDGCGGAYFCRPPSYCGATWGWSHTCQCRTWKLYVSRREELSTFGYLDPDWQELLVGREFQVSEEPYKRFLMLHLMMRPDSDGSDTSDEEYGNSMYDTKHDVSSNPSFSSWWLTETNGWGGGESVSAKQVDITIRRSFEEGFAPLPLDHIPPPHRPSDRDYERAGLTQRADPKNGVGLWKLSSWEEYYRLRNIPSESLVALLCTFPLTIYRAIVEYGEVPVTVARMLKRPLRIHVVGTEKELNFLDLFQELGLLLPEDLKVELVFVAREDMLPKKCKIQKSGSDGFLLRVEMTSNLTVGVVGGTYGCVADMDIDDSSRVTASTASATSLDPNFDCGSGPPDMVIAMNAGLYAYESWRSVVEYLYLNQNVVGVFTDYNEYSGVNCAGLGGSESRESLCINPFRQPLAMPVYSMNLPQFSNGFFYVFNAQELD